MKINAMNAMVFYDRIRVEEDLDRNYTKLLVQYTEDLNFNTPASSLTIYG